MPAIKRVLSSTAMPKQFKMYLPEETVTSLDDAARRFNRRSGQQVAEEILTTYLPFWEQAEQLKLNRIEKQREQMFRPDEDTVAAKSVKPLGTKAKSRKRK